MINILLEKKEVVELLCAMDWHMFNMTDDKRKEFCKDLRRKLEDSIQ